MRCLIPCILAVALIGCALATSKCFTDDERAPKTDSRIEALAEGSAKFAYELFKQVLQAPSDPSPSGNIFISPISVWSALGICYLGAKGQTKKELGRGLGIGRFKQETVADLYPQFQDDLQHNATRLANWTFTLANKLYFDNDVKLQECVSQRLDAELEKADFQTAPEASRELINKYVEEQTNNKITDLIPLGKIDNDTVMVIVNAAYFKGAWRSPFDGFNTKDGEFFVEANVTKNATMMSQRGRFATGEDASLGCSAVELPYSGRDMSMLILLPDANNNVTDLALSLTEDRVNELLDELDSDYIELTIPKFKIEQEMELKGNLQAMGVKDLFDSTKADLSGFTGSNNTFATSIRHKTYVEVAELGTEAAAATGVILMPPSLPLPVPEFRFNRPFVFLLRNKKLNAITFIGLVKDPTEAN